MMENKIRHTKSMVVSKYKDYYDDIMNYLMDTLPDDVRMDASRNYPCDIVKYRHQNKMLTLVLRVCNSCNHFFITNKLKQSRRCDICLDKTTHSNFCYRCEHGCCSNWIKSMSSLVCPFCHYDILNIIAI